MSNLEMRKHARRLWGSAWALPAAGALGYLGLWALAGLRPEHVVLAAAWLLGAYATPASKRFVVHLGPLLGAGILYDLLRFVTPLVVTPDRVVGCELRAFDLTVSNVGHGRTFQEWLTLQHHPALDVVLAIPYLVQAYAAIAYGVYLYFVDRPRLRVYSSAFLLGNCLGMSLWLLIPAAPPWYVHQHGCSIDPHAVASAAGLLRLDELFGVSYFAEYYTRSSNVFAAFPSMHNAYPLFALLTAWGSITWKTRPIHLAYFLSMVLASMYFDHHWLVDAVAGWAVAVASVLVVNYAFVRRRAVDVPLAVGADRGAPARSPESASP